MSATTDAACESRWHLVGPTRAQPVCLECRDLLAAHPVKPAPGVSDEAVKRAANVYWETEGNRAVCMRAALEAALPYLQSEPDCGAVDRSGRRCVFAPGHHEGDAWTSHGARSGWTWNDQPAKVEA